ncbi:MAG: glycosyltransferase family 4 protein [Candidatus Aenigmatarchaeota archaeon]
MEKSKGIWIISLVDPFSRYRRGMEAFTVNLYRSFKNILNVEVLFPAKTKIIRVIRIPLFNKINPSLFQIYIPIENENFWIYLLDIKASLLGLFFYKKIIIGNHGFFKLDFITFLIFIIAKILIRIRSIDFRVHCINNYQKIFFTKILRFPKNRVFLIRNPIFSNEYLKPIKSKNFIVLFLGALNKQKGVDILIDTIKKLYKKSEIKWIIAGLIDKRFIKEIVSLKKLKHVKYLGYVSEKKKRKLFQISSVFVLPSRFEAQPIAVSEALISGVPVILSNLYVLREIVKENNIFGVCLNKNDSDNLSKEIIKYYRKFLKNPERYYLMRVRIMREARKFFDIKKFKKDFLRMLEDA